MGEIINAYKIYSEILKRKGHLEDQGVDGRIILTLILIKHDGRV
jgi:hypothetical protein